MSSTQPATSVGHLHDLKSKLKGKRVILVQGACGTLGWKIVKRLKQGVKGNMAVVAAVSSMVEPNVELLKKLDVDIIHMDLHNHEQCLNAFELGVDKLVVIPPYTNTRVQLVSRLLDIAYEKGIKQLVMVTPAGTQTEDIELFKHNKILQNKARSNVGVKHTFVGATAYMDNVLHLKKLIKGGTLALPSGDGKWAPIWTEDVAEVVTNVLLSDKADIPAYFDICGPNVMNGTEMAKNLSEQIGRTVNFVAMNPDEWRTTVTQLGMPSYKAEDLRDLYQWYAKGNGERPSSMFETICGHKPHTFTEFIKENLNELR